MIVSNGHFDYGVSVWVFHDVVISKIIIGLKYLFNAASWKIPAIYTIGKVLDLKFVETTAKYQ